VVRQAADVSLSPELADVRVWFDEVPATVVVAAAGEVRVIVPDEMAGRPEAQVVIERGGVRSNVLRVLIAGAAPGLFTADGSGSGQAAARNEDGSLNSAEAAAARGSRLTLFATGFGRVERAAGETAAKPVLPVMVTIGGVEAQIVSAAAAADTPGALELTVVVPDGVGPGAAEIRFAAGGAVSQPGTTIAVK
jgi:uncharacterized protein (TIGR03437 family)